MVLIAHAIHAGCSDEEIDAWWEETSSHVRRLRRADLRVVVLADANARLSADNDVTGPALVQKTNFSGDRFTEFLNDFSLVAGSTWGTSCSPSWKSSMAEACIDYVAIPVDWKDNILGAGTCEQVILDLGSHEDHKPVFVRVSTKRHVPPQRPSSTRKICNLVALKDSEKVASFKACLDSYSPELTSG